MSEFKLGQYDAEAWERPWFLGPQAIKAYETRSNYVVLDVETTNLMNGSALNPDNKLVLAVWYIVRDGQLTKKYKFGDEYEMGELLEDIAKAEFVVAHNAKFELHWLARCGLDLHDVLVYDTMVAEWVIHGNIKVPYDLDNTAKRYKLRGKGSLVSKLIKLKVCPSVIPRSWLLHYCDIDVDQCHQIFDRQQEFISSEGLWHIILQRNLVIPVLTDIETKGLQLDKEAVYDEHTRLSGVVEELGKELDEITGGINLGSPAQLGVLLYDTLGFEEARDNAGEFIRTPSGGRSTAAPALARLQATTELQVNFLRLYKEYNNASNLLEKNVNFFKLVCDERDGVFYGQLNHCRTANHRLASSGLKTQFKGSKKELAAQIQNLPRAYKCLFTAHQEGYVVTEYDGSQIEFRVGGDLSGDKRIESDIVNGVDIHSRTRDTMNAAYIKFKIKKEIDRQGAKPNTFAPMYGSAGKDKAEEAYVAKWREEYPDLYRTQIDWTLMVADQKKLKTKYGLTFYWPHATMYRSGYVKHTTEIFNLPISGFATGEIIPIALVFFWHRTRGSRVETFNTVHDSIIVRQPAEDVEYTTEIAKQAMTHDVYGFLQDVYKYTFNVPLGFGCKSGTHWGVSKAEHKWDVWRTGDERYQIEENKKVRVVYDTRNDATEYH